MDEDFWSKHDKSDENSTTIPTLEDQGIVARFVEDDDDPLLTVAGWQEQ
jgi:hypothetical protein